jgi:hypothetical protein
VENGLYLLLVACTTYAIISRKTTKYRYYATALLRANIHPPTSYRIHGLILTSRHRIPRSSGSFRSSSHIPLLNIVVVNDIVFTEEVRDR